MKRGWIVVRRAGGPALLAAALAWAFSLSPLAGQQATNNQREVKTEPSTAEKKTDVWTLDFRFKDPRLIKANIPGRGTRICWYMWYQVINRTGEPRLFVPKFELVTHDFPGVFEDEVLPSVEEEIKKIEDPDGYQDIHNSVTISNKPIPASKPASEAFPRAVTGVAIWDGTAADDKDGERKHKDLSDSTRFTIFVSGLSNGWVQIDPLVPGKDAAPTIRRKTLQLNFKRVGDRRSLDSREIHFIPPAVWVYRASQLRQPGQPPAPANDKMNPPKGPTLNFGPN
jgi:hypothetical protein